MKHRHLMIFFFMSLISTVVVRTLQMLFVIDAETGFFKDSYESMGSAMSAGMVILVAITGLLGYFNDHMPKSAPKNSKLLAISMMLLGVSHILEPKFGNIPPNIPVALVSLRLVFILITGICYIYFAFSIFLNRPINYYLTVIPVVLWIIRLMVTFMSYTSMSNISDNLYDVTMIIVTLVFLLMQSKLLCGVKEGKYSYSVLAMGLMSVLLTAVCTLPRMIIYFFVKSQFFHSSTVDSIATHFFMGLYILMYLITTPYVKRPKRAK